MCSRNIVIYLLSGTAILFVAVLGLAYIGGKAIKPVCRIDQANSDPNLTNRQDQVNDDSVQPQPPPATSGGQPMQSAERDKSRSRLADSLYEEGQAFVEKNYFYEAFVKIRAAFETEPTKIKYRKSLIVLQKLSSAEFLLRRIEAKWEDHVNPVRNKPSTSNGVKVPSLENLLLEAQQSYQRVNNMDTYASNRRIEIKDYLSSPSEGRDSAPDVFSAAKTRLLHRASNLVDEIALELSERPVRQKLDKAWRELNWGGLEELLAQVKEQTAKDQSQEFRKLVQMTEEVLKRYKAYLSAKSSCSSQQMAVLLTEMLNCLEDHNTQDDEVTPASPRQSQSGAGDRFSEVRRWFTSEWNSLLPQVKSRFQTLCDDAGSLVEKYAKTPITDDEISNWGTDTNYESVLQRTKLLSSAHSKLTEAIALAEAVPKAKLDCPLSLQKVESEINRVCAKAYKRAYILENIYGDLDTAGRAYKIVTTLPSLGNNEHQANARRQLQKLHMSEPQKDNE